MLLDDKTEIKVSKKNISHLKDKGYNVKLKDIIEIYTKDISMGSHINVRVKCDICGKEKKIMFQKYIKNVNNGGFYSCSIKCSQNKIKETSKNKYGEEYYTQTKEYKKRIKNTSLNKYGVQR